MARRVVARFRVEEIPQARVVMLRKLVTEALGTFVLVLTVGCAVRGGASFAPLAIGFALMVSVYAGGHISGGHYNPAVSLAAAVRGRLDWSRLVGYWAAQIAGALAAALAAGYIVRPAPAHKASPVADFGPVFLAELVFTFVLAFVVLNVATSKDHPDNSFYGLAIGSAVFVGAVAVGPVSGGAFNPAVALGGSALGLFAWQSLWLYVVANLLGGALAGAAFRALNPEDK
ncbi:MIP/aquaporin family protein [Segniliparus rugosus]|uniref:Porin n=1 Tax=Segniliparus rugosus (strain ATCC BAA-974 / DSM 45345 / CCUG 50838 / CIP 108380 / JCM 13579 / CDC 945) TaxID=679197 RepID=E5XPS3_SEGRC|nr:aquaporin [Segniliparus rugosus]EFV13671.1 hypothetical protein HMPREF9336_01495 [Segniliparus rugosus ATCC BAA-974]